MKKDWKVSGSPMKVARGTARAKRRQNMTKFRKEQAERNERMRSHPVHVNAPSMDLMGFLTTEKFLKERTK